MCMFSRFNAYDTHSHTHTHHYTTLHCKTPHHTHTCIHTHTHTVVYQGNGTERKCVFKENDFQGRFQRTDRGTEKSQDYATKEVAHNLRWFLTHLFYWVLSGLPRIYLPFWCTSKDKIHIPVNTGMPTLLYIFIQIHTQNIHTHACMHTHTHTPNK